MKRSRYKKFIKSFIIKNTILKKTTTYKAFIKKIKRLYKITFYRNDMRICDFQ